VEIKWDYTNLSKRYDKRVDYSEILLSTMIRLLSLPKNSLVVDAGAGTGKLTKFLVKNELNVIAIEPNIKMMELGKRNTKNYNIKWKKDFAEKMHLKSSSIDAFFMGSSFNVVDREKTLREAHRVLKKEGHFIVIWNNRCFEHEPNKSIESIINNHIKDYNYGMRRLDTQIISSLISENKLFDEPTILQHKFKQIVNKNDFLQGWYSHATLKRQSGSNFQKIIKEIEKLLKEYNEKIEIFFNTRIWISKRKI
jgi:ubiquinone/menaquinone biosynthesis C-methylase UbiE